MNTIIHFWINFHNQIESMVKKSEFIRSELMIDYFCLNPIEAINLIGTIDDLDPRLLIVIVDCLMQIEENKDGVFTGSLNLSKVEKSPGIFTDVLLRVFLGSFFEKTPPFWC